MAAYCPKPELMTPKDQDKRSQESHCLPAAFPATTVPIMNDGIRIKDMPENERPRERLAELGAHALRDAELIAILLRTGTKGRSAVQIGDELVQKFQSLNALARASLKDLSKTKGIGRDKAIALTSAFTLAARMARELQREDPVLDTPERWKFSRPCC
jgi:DNA repair protein RadC